MSKSRLDSIRKSIVERQSKTLEYESLKGGLLALAVVIGTFGSAAVLMPNDVTGDFSAGLNLESFQIEDTNILEVNMRGDKMIFVQDFEIKNPNVLPARFEAMSYRAQIDGETIGKGKLKASEVIEAGKTQMLTIANEASKEGIEGTKDISVEGKLVFNIGGEEFDQNYRYFFTQDF